MTVQFYPNGIGGAAPGDSLDLARPLQCTCNVWYVSSLIGTDAASPAGQNREKPLATAAQAITNAADDDIIVFLAGHTQALAANQAVAKRLTFIGEGTSSGKPAAQFTDAGGFGLFNVTAANVEFRNIYFPATPPPVASSTAKVSFAGARGRLVGCWFDQGANDTFAQAVVFKTGADQLRIESCTFLSTATSTAAQPLSAISGFSSSTIADLEITNTVVSSGTVGWKNYAAIDLAFNSSVVTRAKITGLSLLLGADMTMGASATGYVNVAVSTGGSRVSWA
jgi:hypothetical protein